MDTLKIRGIFIKLCIILIQSIYTIIAITSAQSESQNITKPNNIFKYLENKHLFCIQTVFTVEIKVTCEILP